MPAKPELTQVEKDKLSINPDFDFKEIARTPLEDIPPNVLAMFKWSGVYQQLQKGFFMIRLRVPGGILTSAQVEKAADLCERYGQDELCITTRQCLQFHWIRKEDIYKIMDGMRELGVLTKNACGDVTRNVVSCSLEGVCVNELADTRKVLRIIADDPELLDQQRNLPRKHKISVAGCGRSCGQTLMNCQGWYPVNRVNAQGVEEIGWKFHAGGGLGALPHIAKAIFDWVPEDMVLDVARASTEAFRRYGDRTKRRFARLKIFVEKVGAVEYGKIVLGIMKERGINGLERIIPSPDGVPDVQRSYLNGQFVIEQKQKGFYTVRVIIKRSEITSKEARFFAKLARDFGNGEIMFTNRQNLELRFVPESKLGELTRVIKESGYMVFGFDMLPDIVSCVGTTVCNLAVSDTPNMYKKLIDELGSDVDYAKKIGPLKININGCPNSCGQHWIVDIGLRGMRLRGEQGSEEGFAIYLGGKLSEQGHIGELFAEVATPEVIPMLRKVLDNYIANRKSDDEVFVDYVSRVGISNLAGIIGGAKDLSEKLNIKNLGLKQVFDQAMDENKQNNREN